MKSKVLVSGAEILDEKKEANFGNQIETTEISQLGFRMAIQIQ